MASIPPTIKIFELNGNHVTTNWKVVITFLMILIGGTGGYAGFRLVSYAEAEEMISKAKKESDTKYESLSKNVDNNTETIGKVLTVVQDVQERQHEDIASREARRLVEDIECKKWDRECEHKKDQARDRIRRINKNRLRDKKELCATINCAN